MIRTATNPPPDKTSADTATGGPRLSYSSVCPQSGSHCHAGFAMARQLAAALGPVRHGLSPEFEISGEAELGCLSPGASGPKTCPFAWHATPERTHVFCNPNPRAEIDTLLSGVQTLQHLGVGLLPQGAQEAETKPVPASAMLICETAAPPPN